jgi:GNAT superfamily N-acetyltransferase
MRIPFTTVHVYTPREIRERTQERPAGDPERLPSGSRVAARRSISTALPPRVRKMAGLGLGGKLYRPGIYPMAQRPFRGAIAQMHLDMQQQSSQESTDPAGVARRNDAINICRRLAKECESTLQSYEAPLAYFERGEPVGLALTVKDDEALPHLGPHLFVSHIVTHPRTRSVGSALMEAIVNRSEASGGDGRVVLESFNENSTAAWHAMGFVQTGALMQLEPSRSDRWRRVDDQWQYISRSRLAEAPRQGSQ